MEAVADTLSTYSTRNPSQPSRLLLTSRLTSQTNIFPSNSLTQSVQIIRKLPPHFKRDSMNEYNAEWKFSPTFALFTNGTAKKTCKSLAESKT